MTADFERQTLAEYHAECIHPHMCASNLSERVAKGNRDSKALSMIFRFTCRRGNARTTAGRVPDHRERHTPFIIMASSNVTCATVNNYSFRCFMTVRRDGHLFPPQGEAVDHLLSYRIDQSRSNALPTILLVNPHLLTNAKQSGVKST